MLQCEHRNLESYFGRFFRTTTTTITTWFSDSECSCTNSPEDLELHAKIIKGDDLQDVNSWAGQIVYTAVKYEN